MSDQVTTTSPNLPVDSGIMKTQKQFSDNLTQELTDEEIVKAQAIIMTVKSKWEGLFVSRYSHRTNFTAHDIDNALKLVNDFEDELKTRLATEVGVLAAIDVTPLLEGKGVEIEYLGVIKGHDINKHGFDHEKKEWEVKRATAKGEDFLGQKEQ